MNLSAILVVVSPKSMDPMCETITDLPGLEVHHIDEATGRLIVTQEAESINQEVDGLRRLQQLPGVILAEMVEHHFDSETAPAGQSAVVIPASLCQ